MGLVILLRVLDENMYITVYDERNNDVMFEGLAGDAVESLRGWNPTVKYIDENRSQGFGNKGIYIEVRR